MKSKIVICLLLLAIAVALAQLWTFAPYGSLGFGGSEPLDETRIFITVMLALSIPGAYFFQWLFGHAFRFSDKIADWLSEKMNNTNGKNVR
jgi:CRP-like cAMP-binding protein